MMKKLFVLLFSLPALSFAQNSGCRPFPGTTNVCDSVSKICNEAAYTMTQRACGMTTSVYYDSLYCPEGYYQEFNFALRSFYNDVPDSLSSLREYIGSAAIIPKDADTLITIIVSYRGLQQPGGNGNSFGSGNRQIDSLCAVWKFRLVSKQTASPGPCIVTYRCPKMISRSYVYRQLSLFDPMMQVSGYYPPGPYDMLQVSLDNNNGDQITIAVCPTSPCMPPELPCSYIKRTFIAQREWSCRYISYEAGIIPWPIPVRIK